MKKKEDRLPTLKADLLKLYLKWKGENRSLTEFDESAHVIAMEAGNNVLIDDEELVCDDEDVDIDDDIDFDLGVEL